MLFCFLIRRSPAKPAQAAQPGVSQTETQVSSDSGKKANLLIHEKSPLLLRHAHDPVDWHPWSDEVFEEARKQNKPVFLSIGYASCFACYTMQREVFEDPGIAAEMNATALNVLVDREERPEIDRLYMSVLQT